MYKLNDIYVSECVEGMKNIPDNYVDVTVTSPPYDNLRDYKGYTLNLHEIGKELYRITKDGGIVAMVIQDQTKDFGKSLTSFKTIIDWCDNIGFKLFETVIYKKLGNEGGWWNKRFRVDHEYMPIFLKGSKPQFFDKEGLKLPSKHAGKTMTGGATRKRDGSTVASQSITINAMKCRGTIWDYSNGGDKNRVKRQHPATYPDKIPYDFIQCFCPQDGIVFDPMMGSGSTGVAAKILDRNYLGFDMSEEYVKIAKERIDNFETNLKEFIKK
jgi:site-specific DNA-methyltransferase (adenine-specific)